MLHCQKKGHIAKDCKSGTSQSGGAASGGQFGGFFMHGMSMPDVSTSLVSQSSSQQCSTVRHENADDHAHKTRTKQVFSSKRVFGLKGFSFCAVFQWLISTLMMIFSALNCRV